MNQSKLFRLKEQSLKQLEQSLPSLTFKSEEEKLNYYNAAVDGIVTLYTLAMVELIDSEIQENHAA